MIQIRVKEDILSEERQSFLDCCGLTEDELLVLNPIIEPMSEGHLEDVQAFLIGGSGAYSVTNTYNWTPHLLDYLDKIFERSIPVFGSCWGHQFLARALGGEVIHDTSQSEMGTHYVDLCEPGRNDSLFSVLPDRFLAQQGHQDRVSKLPDDCIELASSSVARNQAFRSISKPIFGTQFHAELSAENERNRLDAYRQSYPHLNEEEFREVYEAVRDTPEVSGLLPRFLSLAKDGLL